MPTSRTATKRSRLVLTQAFALVLTGVIALPTASVDAATQVTDTFNYTGSTQIFTVPPGVTSIEVTIKGGQGGKGGHDSQGTPTPGGYQGVVTGTIAVTPGQQLTVAVGGGGGEGGSSRTNSGAGTAGLNPLSGYDGAIGGNPGNSGSSGAGGGSGAASVLIVDGTPIVAAGAGGNGGSGQFTAIVGRRAEGTHTARPDAVSTSGRPGWNTVDACTVTPCDGGASGAGGGGAVGGERGTIQYGGGTNTEYFGFGGYPGASSTAGLPGLGASYDYYEGNSAHGSMTITYNDGAPSAPLNLTGSSATNAVRLAWNEPSGAGSSPITDYLVEYAESVSGPFSTFDDGVSLTTSAEVTGLTNGVTYHFRVSAINDNGAGTSATTTVGIVPSDVPGRPIVDSVTVFGGGTYVDFTPGSSDIAITSYEYRLDGGGWQSGSVSAGRMTITGLTNGSTYSIEIRSINEIGPSLPSDPAVSATPIDVSHAPSGTLLSAADATIDATWNAPADDNGSPVSDYLVQWATSIDGTYTAVDDGVSTDTTHRITGLDNGTTYFVRIAAVNAAGSSAWSTPVSATPYTTPSAPTIDVTPGDGSLTVGITPGFDGGSAVTSWQYRLDGGVWMSTGSLTHVFSIFGLANSTSYDISVRAINAAGIGAASSVVSATPRTVPAAPSISAVALNTGAVSVTFTVGAEGGSPISNVQYSIDGGVTWITRSPASASSPLTITGLTGGQTYPIQLRVLNDAGASDPSNTSMVTAKGTPAAPTIVVSPADSSLVVTFAAPSNGGSPITNYEYSTDNGVTWTTPSPAATSPITITGLTNGTAYEVRVRAVNVVGFSPASAATTATPRTVPGAPTIDGNTVASGTGTGTGTLSAAFTAPTSDGGSAILTYQYSTDAGSTWRTRDDGDTVASPLVITTESADGTTLLTGGKTYPVELRAVNAAGAGTASAVATGIPRTAPDAPVIDDFVVGNGQVTIRFSPPANGGEAITSYEYSIGGGSWVDTGSLADEFVIAGLANATSPSIEMRAINSVGASVPSESVIVNVFTTPAAPTLDGITAGDATLAVAFFAGANGGSPITTYEYSTDGGETWRTRSTGTTASPLTIDTESDDGSPLLNGTIYDVQIRAVNAAGAGAASESQLAAPRGVPAAPTGLTVTGADAALVIAFTPGHDGGSPLATVEYQLDGEAWLDAGSLSSPFNIPGLVNGTTYDVAVRTVNAIGASPATPSESGIPRTVPGAPTAVAATDGPRQVTVSWSAPAGNGGSPIIGYTVSVYAAATGGSPLATCTTTDALTCVVTGLTNGVTVYADVVAENEAGAGAASAPRVVAVPLGAPVVQIDSVTSSATSLTIDVDLDDGGRPVTDYEYQLDGGAWQSASSGSSPFIISGLVTGVEYSVRIRAVGPGGTSEPSDSVLATPYTLPGVPTTLSATSGATSAVLTWTAPSSDGGTPLTDYVVQYATSAGGTFTTFADGTSASTGATVTGLTNATTYFFRVAARNAAGTGANSSLASTTPLGAPSAPTITGVTPGSTFLQVSYTAPSNNGGAVVTSYQYRLDGGVWRTASGSSSPTTITGLTNGTLYSVEMRAVNTVGGGTASAAVSSTPYGLPGAIVGFRATPGANSVLLEWDTGNANGSPITAYNVIRWSAANEGAIVVPTYQTTATSQLVTGLGNGTYYFTIEATNAAGTGPRSTPRTTAIVGSTLPSAPTSPALMVDDNDAVLTWTAGAAVTPATASYIVQYSTDGTQWRTMASGSPATSASFDLPSTTTVYKLRVAGVSAAGVGSFVEIAPPLASTGAVSAMTMDSADLAGSIDANSGSVTGSFEYAIDPADLGTPAASTIAATPGAVEGVGTAGIVASATDLAPGSHYSVRAVATTSSATVRGATVTFTTRVSIVTDDVIPTYTGSPVLVQSTTNPPGLALSRTFVGIDPTVYPSSSTPPTDVGTYEMTTVSLDDELVGSEVVTLTIQPKPAVVTVSGVDRPFDGTTAVELSLGLDGVVVDDDVTVVAANISGEMVDANVGVDKSVDVIVDGPLVSGADASSYHVTIAESADVTITKLAQTLEFTTDAPEPARVGSTYGPGVESSAGLVVSIAVDESSDLVCSIAGGVVTLVTAGECVLVASQAGTGNVKAASPTFQTFEVMFATDPSVTIDMKTGADRPVGGTVVTLQGAGLRPGSIVTIQLDGVSIGAEVRVGSDGTYQATVELPENIAAGAHALVVSAIGWDDTAVTTVENFIVDGPDPVVENDGAGYVAIAATRILDTREVAGRLVAETEYRVGLPSGLVTADATALTINLTVTNPAAQGYITVYPCDAPRPHASATNFTAGETRANFVDVPLGSGTAICLWSLVDTDAVIDVQGFHAPTGDSRLVPRIATRLVDTRPDGELDAGETRVIDVVGTGMASQAATVVALNVVVTGAEGPGFITVFPCGTDRPWASNLNFTVGQTVSNEVFVAPGEDGTVCVYSLTGAHLVVDLGATFEPNGSLDFSSTVANRIGDSRLDEKLAAGETREWTVAGGVAAAALNVAATATGGRGYLTVFPCDLPQPPTSNVNFYMESQTASNHVTVSLDDDGKVCVYASTAAHVVIDVEGVYRPTAD